MNKFKLFVLFFMLVVVLFLFGGCNKRSDVDDKTREASTVPHDEYLEIDNNEFNAFTVKDIAIDLGEDSDNLEIKNTIFRDNCLVCYVSGFHSVPSEDEEPTEASLQVDEVFCYGYDGELIWKLDILDSISQLSDKLYLERELIDVPVFEYDNNIYISIINTDNGIERRYYSIDVASGNMSEESKSGEEIGLGRSGIIPDAAYNQFNGEFNDYRISQYYNNEDGMTYLSVIKSNGEQNIINVKQYFDFLEDTNIYIKGIYPINNNEVLLKVVGTEGYSFYKLNIQDPKVESIEMPAQFLCAESDIICHNDVLFFDFGDGILNMNPQNGEIKEALNYNNCFYNMAKLRNATLASVQNDKIVYKASERENDNYSNHYYVLNKNKFFDYEAKHKLVATSLRNLTYANAEAIQNFNNSNDEYYIEYTCKHQLSTGDSTNSIMHSILNADKIVDSKDELRPDGLTYKLVADMNNGCGPDIILEADALCGLYAEEYLQDLSSYIDEIGISREDYFSNIVNLMCNGGKCVQIPLSFEVPCLLWNSEANNQMFGFSIDEYKSFVDDNCQGVDPLSYGYDSIEEVETLFNNSYDKMVDEEGNFNVDNEVFRQIVEFCKSNNQDFSFENIPQNPQIMKIFLSIDNINEVVDRVLCGFPSNDRRTPGVNVFSSIAISGSCDSEQAIREFIKLVLSDDIQKLQDKLPVSKKAFSDIVSSKCGNNCKLDEIIDNFNRPYVVDVIANRLIRRELKKYFNDTITLDEAMENINKNYRELNYKK